MGMYMVKILIDLSDEEDKIAEVYKVVNGLKTKQEAVKRMVRHFKVSITPTNLDKHDEYYKKTVKF
ncbi:MAG: DUF2683 family protein [Candidatus Micrarchaeota archaeon]|nr:DUF2683 family protein [Candidatus Micrarchaeota archaeon]